MVGAPTDVARGAAAMVESPADAPTSAEPVIGPAPDSPPPSISSPSGPQGGRFLPGTVIADRYRVIGIVGRGGMGEVYRADDLKLGQTVALKFLPENLADDEDRRERLFDEVRAARKVSHPNVCRVWDIGEADGHQFISMEFVDGEDLASLLRRIGRAPKEKAAQIARQLCAGLAAAHEEGVLHRDMKPANVMIDGRGRVRLTDFGLASIAGEASGDERAGTPIYMAPELLSGGTPSASTDIYALGLVLYELFTGKRAYKAESLQELLDLQSATSLTSPGSLVDGMDPAVERIILACLNHDPRKRPQTALGVAAALPGGDPLAAALAAGETPAPELVAAAEVEGALSPPVAAACLGSVAVILVLLTLWAPYFQISRMAPFELSGDALELRARDILTSIGIDEPAASQYHWLFLNGARWNYLMGLTGAPKFELAGTWPGPFTFGYRQSPTTIEPLGSAMTVDYGNPPLATPGEARVALHPSGVLSSLGVVAHAEWFATGPREVDWQPLFEAAGLDIEAFTPVQAEWQAAVATDTRLAWTGPHALGDDVEVTVEAGAVGGRPVHFFVTGPWNDAQAVALPAGIRAVLIIVAFWFFAAIIATIVIARRNIRLGRGDRVASLRLAIAIAALWFVNWLTFAQHVVGSRELGMFIMAAGYALFWGAFVWAVYMAIEPYYRRTWPQQLVSWVRLVNGNLRDPLVGRDLLFGVLWGCVITLSFPVVQMVTARIGVAVPPPTPGWGGGPFNAVPAEGIGDMLAMLTETLAGGVLDVVVLIITLVTLRLLLRNTLAAVAVVLALNVLLTWNVSQSPVFSALALVLAAAGFFFLFRFGVLFFVVANIAWNLLPRFPLTSDVGAWYFGNTLFVLLIVGGLAAYGFSTSLAGKSVFGDDDAGPAPASA